jgi:hypothetical protein
MAWPIGSALEASMIALGRDEWTAAETFAPSHRFPFTSVTFERRDTGTLFGLRTNAVTAHPCASARSSTRLPALPVAP